MRKSQKLRLVIQLSSVLLLFLSCSNTPVLDTGPATTDTRPIDYLAEVTSPCTPLDDSGQDPCGLGTVIQVEASSSISASLRPLGDRKPNFTDRFLGTDLTGRLVPHIAIRGTAQPDTTRCEVYSVTLANYVESSFDPNETLFYYCFVDITVGEYLVGTGPPTLTVAMHRENIWPLNVDEWPDVRESWIKALSDPRARTAAAYEGRELVMLLRPTSTIKVEAWTSRGLFTLWFVQRDNGDEIRAVAQEMYRVETEEQRSSLDLLLSDLVSQIRAAGAARVAWIAAVEDSSESRSVTSSTSSGASTTVTTQAGIVRPAGGIGARSPVPLLVTDANYLRDLYVEVGATYVGDDATTVLPPPPPEAPGVPTNVGLSVEDGVVLVRWDEPESGGDVVEYRVWLLSELAGG